MHSLRKTADADPATTFIGIPTSLPIFVSPAAAAGLGNPEGELSITRGAGKSGIIQCVRQFEACSSSHAELEHHLLAAFKYGNVLS